MENAYEGVQVGDPMGKHKKKGKKRKKNTKLLLNNLFY